MAVTNITLTQDNTNTGSRLLPVHSPLIFLAEATYTGVAPDFLSVQLYDFDDNLLDTYKGIYYEDTSSTTRVFMFDSGVFLRSYMGSFDDSLTIENSLSYVEGITKQFKINFYDSDSTEVSETFFFDAIHGYSQFSEQPNLVSIYRNLDKTYYKPVNDYCYVYFYANAIGITIEVYEDDTIKSSNTITEIGYYRYKFNTNPNLVKFKRDDEGFFIAEHTIESIGCSDSKIVKYLNREGQYLFYAFNKEIKINDNPSSLGSVLKTVTNIRTDQSDTEQVGYTNERNIALVEKIPTSHLDILSDIYTSPRIYYKIGTDDQEESWLLVERTGGNLDVVNRNKLKQRFDIELKLPTHYSTKMV